jgi:hypothetical protein
MEPITGRQYKSRKARPCDFCRKRKVACHMEISPPCEMCRQRQRPCTFARGPGIRTRPNNQQRQKEGSSQEVQYQQLNESSGLNEQLLYQDAQGLSNQNFGLNVDPNLDDMFGIFDYDIQFDHLNSPNHIQEKLPSMSGFGREVTQQMSPRGGISGSFHSSTSHATNSFPLLILPAKPDDSVIQFPGVSQEAVRSFKPLYWFHRRVGFVSPASLSI